MVNLKEAITIIENSKKGMKVIGASDHSTYFSFGLAPIEWDGDSASLPVNSAAYCVDKKTGKTFEKHIVDMMLEDDMGIEIEL